MELEKNKRKSVCKISRAVNRDLLKGGVCEKERESICRGNYILRNFWMEVKLPRVQSPIDIKTIDMTIIGCKKVK